MRTAIAAIREKTCIVLCTLLLLLGSILSARTQNDIKLRSVEETLRSNRDDALIGRKFIYGFQVGVNVVYGHGNESQFRFCFSGGVARGVDINKPLNGIGDAFNADKSLYVTPPMLVSFQPELLIYRGGLGSSLMIREKGKIHCELRNSFGLTLGYSSTCNGEFRNKHWGRPMSKMEANSQAALYDPYGISVTAATTFVTDLTSDRHQQVGNFNLGLGPVQLDYSNDGPFFDKMVFSSGDAYDRWWTGGGHIGVYLPSDHALVTEIVLRYDKFTGFQQNAYEVARQLRLDYIPYIDAREAFKNQGGYNITVGFQNNLNIGFNVFEVGRFDMQNLIHTTLGMPFHQPQLKTRQSVCYGYRAFNTFSKL